MKLTKEQVDRDLYCSRNNLPFDKQQTELERLDAEIARLRSRSLPREAVGPSGPPEPASESPQERRNRLGRDRVRSGSRPTEPRGGRIEHR